MWLNTLIMANQSPLLMQLQKIEGKKKKKKATGMRKQLILF
jgi:hypothetical protein